MQLTVSAVIPVHNAAPDLARCLESLRQSSVQPLECIVVDDGSTDESPDVARAAKARVLSTGGRRGPAVARNLGARAASGDLLFFLDADVAVHRHAIRRMLERFADSPPADAVIGSYDDAPPGGGIVSQYKNLQHHYVHQNGSPEANTFWTGCGMVRRDVFLEAGGFDEGFAEPSIEDIELGYRLRMAGRRIVLEKSAQVKHFKQWTLMSLLRTDILLRGMPWTELSLRYRRLPNDLNVSGSQRASVALVWGAAAAAPIALLLRHPLIAVAGGMALSAVLAINSGFYRFLAQRRGALFAVPAAALHVLYFFYCGLAFALGLSKYLLHRKGGPV